MGGIAGSTVQMSMWPEIVVDAAFAAQLGYVSHARPRTPPYTSTLCAPGVALPDASILNCREMLER